MKKDRMVYVNYEHPSKSIDDIKKEIFQIYDTQLLLNKREKDLVKAAINDFCSTLTSYQYNGSVSISQKIFYDACDTIGALCILFKNQLYGKTTCTEEDRIINDIMIDILTIYKNKIWDLYQSLNERTDEILYIAVNVLNDNLDVWINYIDRLNDKNCFDNYINAILCVCDTILGSGNYVEFKYGRNKSIDFYRFRKIIKHDLVKIYSTLFPF